MTTAQASTPDPEATAANRRGELTPEQQQRLAAAIWNRYSVWLVLTGFFAAMSLLILLVGAATPSARMGTRDLALFGGLTVLFAGGSAWAGVRLAAALRELRAGRIEQATGQVVWERGYYRAAISGRKLELDGLKLGMGTYEFYYLPGSGRVAAAERLAGETPAQAQDQLTHALAMATGFNADHLPAYRQGRLAGDRLERLRRMWGSAAWTLLFVGVALAAFLYLVNIDEKSQLLPVLCVGDLFGAVLGLGYAAGALLPTIDVLSGQVDSAEGVVEKLKVVTYGRSSRSFFYYQIGAQRWRVSPQAYRALMEGQGYRVYYLPRSKQLVAVEPVSVPDSQPKS